MTGIENTDAALPDESIADLKRKFLALFEPASVAIVGASVSPLKWGFRIIFNTVMGGYKGALYAVNPNHNEVIGVDCYPSPPPPLATFPMTRQYSIAPFW